MYFIKGNSKGSKSTQTDCEPSFWHSIVFNAHFKIAAIHLTTFQLVDEIHGHIYHAVQITRWKGTLSSGKTPFLSRQEFIMDWKHCTLAHCTRVPNHQRLFIVCFHYFQDNKIALYWKGGKNKYPSCKVYLSS